MTLFKGIAFCLAVCVLSLPGAAAGQAEHSSDEVRIVQTTGFSFPELGDEIQLVATEISNGVLYTLDVRREIQSDPNRFSDGVPLLRLTQTIRPLAELGTVDDLQQAVLSDAYGLIDKTLNPSPEPPQVLTREIMGQVRAGQAFRATFGLDADAADASIAGMVECYAFEHEGSGIAVILKHTDTVAQTKAEDEEHLDSILGNLAIKPVTLLTPYTYTIAGVPVSLPLGSRVTETQQISESAIRANVQLGTGSLALFLARIAPGTADAALGELLRQHVEQIEVAVRESTGDYKVIWDSRTALPPGPGKSQPLLATAYLVDTPTGPVYSLFCGNAMNEIAITGTFTLSPESPELAHKYLQIFTDGFLSENNAMQYGSDFLAFPGHEITLPGDFHVGQTIRNDEGEIEAVLVNLIGPVIAENVLNSAGSHRSFTMISTIKPGDEAALETLHARVCERLSLAALDKPLPDDAPAPDLGEAFRVFADGPGSREYLRNTFIPVSVNKLDPIIVSSSLLPEDSSGVRLMMTSVSNTMMVDDEMAMTEWLITQIKPRTNSGRFTLDFGVLVYDHLRVPLTVKSFDVENYVFTEFQVGGEWVEVYTYGSDPRNEVLSSRVLAGRYLKLIWRNATFQDEHDLYPKDSENLIETSVGRHNAVMFQAHLPGKDSDPTRSRSTDARIRCYGIAHGDKYSVIKMRQYENFDDARFDRIIKMFESIN